MRTFIALKLKEETRGALSSLVSCLKKEIGRVSWVNTDNLHLTLKFLGEVPENRLEEIKRALSLIAVESVPFGYSVESLGCFPNVRNPRVIWAGLHGNLTALNDLQLQIDKSMDWLGFERERRGFKPHITLGRVKGVLNSDFLEEQINDFHGEFFGEEWVESICLIKSDLRPGGAQYTVLKEFDF